MIDRLRDFYEEHKQPVLIGVVILFALIVGGVMILSSKEAQDTQKLFEQQTFDNQLADVQKTFSELQNLSVGYLDKRVAKEVTLFLKKPFISDVDFRRAIYNYVELLKYQTNNEKKDTYLAGVRIYVYDRIENYEMELNPRATASYMLSDVDAKKIKEAVGMTPADVQWEESLNQKKEPKYSKYALLMDFQEFDISMASPLSNQEYGLLRKLLLYESVLGSRDAAINQFLFWELGVPRGETNILLTNQFKEFISYAQDYGENLSLYQNQEIRLKEKLAVDNPRFLAYLETGVVYESKLDAKRALVKRNREMYLPVYIREAQDVVKRASESEGAAILKELNMLENTTQLPDVQETDPTQSTGVPSYQDSLTTENKDGSIGEE